jgi:hypothetical protein
LGARDEYNQLGEVCELRKQAKGEEIYMVNNNNFKHSSFWYEEQVERERKRARSWRYHGGKIIEHPGAYLELKTKEPGCQS